MGHSLRWLSTLYLFISLAGSLRAQTPYTLSGRVTDAATGEAIPFASLAIQGKPAGTSSDADGRYLLRTTLPGDSLLVSSLGYQTRAFALQRGRTQVVNAQLTANTQRLQEVKVYAKGGDPAYRVLREAIRLRPQHDPALKLTAFQYESYTKIEAYVNNFANRRKTGKRAGQLRQGPVGKLLAKLPAVTDADGKPAVPVFISENYSEVYGRNNPDKLKERVLKTRVTGVGISDGSLVAQLTGASFQQYNFYRPYLNILRKDIPSPFGEHWQRVYTYRMTDTVRVGQTVCYEIQVEPKRTADLAFSGTIWVDTTQLALAQLDVSVGNRANINFVDDLHIEQEWNATPAGAWLPTQTVVSIDTDEPTPNAPGALVRLFSAARNVTVNEPKEPGFYDPPIELADDYRERSPAFWKTVRPDSLSPAEQRAFAVMDSVRNVPFMKTMGDIIRLGVLGYQPLGKLHLDLGPLLNTYAYNNVEGHRLRLGLRTNKDFSRKWVLSGFAAYGTKDGVWKYNLGVDYILKRRPWTIAGVRHGYDIERIGISQDNVGTNSLFFAYSRFGTFRRPYYQQDNYAYIRRELGKGFTQTLALRNRTFEPGYPFAYQLTPDSPIRSGYRTTEFIWETRLATDEVLLQNDNERFNTGATRKPVYTFRYVAGLNHVLGGDFSYHRLSVDMRHSFRLGPLGRTYYNINAGLIPSTIPYPLLYTPLGNETSFYVYYAYNLMNFFEFVCDRWASVQVEHNFEGLLFNRIPAIRRLKWRFLTTAKVLAGHVSDANVAAIPAVDAQGNPVAGFRALGRTPYVEVGYGIDNIFKVMRIDALHRLTYRDNRSSTGVPVTPFAVKASFWLSL